jgi:hypothetical protein
MRRTMKYMLVSCAFVATLFLGACSGGSPISPGTQITFPNDGAHGIFDPSIARDPATGKLWMSYSSVDPSATWPANVNVVATHLAYSDDNGNTWTVSSSGAIINNYADVTLPSVSPNDGTWVNEVSQLIYDPNAVPGEEWKILWHHYLNIHNVRHFEHGWIAMKAASTPEGLAAATEIKLFGGYLYDSANDTAGGTTKSPVGGAPQIQLDTVNSALDTCVFSEPGMYSSGSALYMSLLCVKIPGPEHLIALFKCTGSCTTGGGWSYLGTALNNADAASFGYDTGFSASGIFASGGNVYLVATPVQTIGAPWADYYSGCRIFRFANIDTALLQKTGSVPTLIGSVNGAAGSFNGACAYHASSNMSGMLYSELNTSTFTFQIFKSHINF